MNNLDLTADIIDVRDIIARIEELNDDDANDANDANDAEELSELQAIMDDLKGMGGDEQWEGDWYPVTLIDDNYFEAYAQELAEEICVLPDTWPANCIDWTRAARELQHDYSSVNIGHNTYWTR